MRYFCWWFCATQLNNTRKSIWIISPENRNRNRAAGFLFPEWRFLFPGCFSSRNCVFCSRRVFVPGRVFSFPGEFSVCSGWACFVPAMECSDNCRVNRMGGDAHMFVARLQVPFHCLQIILQADRARPRKEAAAWARNESIE